LIRIIAGRWRGTKLAVVNDPGLRPTANRTRETLFNWLQADIVGVRCLDLFAGTGALSFEALSRGAARAVLLETQTAIVHQLEKQSQAFALSPKECTVIQTSAAAYLSSAEEKSFDWVFMDPPFQDTRLCADMLSLLEQQPWFQDLKVLYVERARGSEALSCPLHWAQVRSLTTAEVEVHLFKNKAFYADI
jgi:16S rRNA (guanine966-N2)-methyltransferase